MPAAAAAAVLAHPVRDVGWPQWLAALAVLVAVLLLARSLRGRLAMGPVPQRVFLPALAAYLLGSLAYLLYHTYWRPGPDFQNYYAGGEALWRLLWNTPDGARGLWTMPPAGQVPPAVQAQYAGRVPLLTSVYNVGMLRVAAVLQAVSGGNLLVAAQLLALGAFSGLWVLYQRLERAYPKAAVQLLGVLLWPSIVFWTGGYSKEPLVMGALAALSAAVVPGARWPRWAWGLLVLSVAVAYTVKPYPLLAWCLAMLPAAGWWAWQQPRLRIRRWVLLLLLLACAVALVMGSSFDWVRVAGEVAYTRAEQQEAAAALAAQGAQRKWVDNGWNPDSGPWQLLWVAPQAVFTALFRPMPWDVRDLATGLAAAENLLFLGGIVYLMGTSRWRRAVAVLRQQPWLLGWGLLVLGYAFFLGISILFLGTLVRYRSILWPLLWAAACILRLRTRAPHPHAPVGRAARTDASAAQPA